MFDWQALTFFHCYLMSSFWGVFQNWWISKTIRKPSLYQTNWSHTEFLRVWKTYTLWIIRFLLQSPLYKIAAAFSTRNSTVLRFLETRMPTKPEQGLELRKKFASMEAQLSGLQKMFCPLSESVNVNKNRVESYTCVSFSDYKPTRPTTSSPGPFPRLGGVPHTSATKPAKRPWERGCPPQTIHSNES